MFMTLGSVNLPKPDYSQLYAKTIEEYTDFIQRAHNSTTFEIKADYYASACMRLLKTSHIVSFIVKLLSEQCLQPTELEPAILNACTELWANQTLFHLIKDPNYDFNACLQQSGQHVTDTVTSILEFGNKAPPEPPTFTTLKAAHVLRSEKNYDELRAYFVNLQFFCDRRDIIVGIHDQVKLPNGYYPEQDIPLTYHQVLDLYFTINDDAKYRPTFSTFLTNRKFEGWENEVKAYQIQPVKKRSAGRPKKELTEEEKAKNETYLEAKKEYQRAVKALTEFNNKYEKEKKQYVDAYNASIQRLSAVKRDM